MGQDLHFPFRASARPGYWNHDCERCRYRGSFVTVPGRRGSPVIRDVYVCDEADGETIIMRFGNDGPEYESFPRRLVEHIARNDDFGNFAQSTWAFALRLVREYRTFQKEGYVAPIEEQKHQGFVVYKRERIDLSDDYGGRAVTFDYIEFLPDDATGEERREFLAKLFPPTHCQHEHDCCGHYYASSPRIRALPNGRWIVRQGWTQNV